MFKTTYPIIGGKYEHYKGGVYEVVSLAQHTETNEAMVIYKSLLFGTIYARPLTSWNEPVTYETFIGQTSTRFTLIEK